MSDLGEHDGDGIRYAMHLSAPKGGSAQMLRDPAGGWVSWEDYARLKADVERLTFDPLTYLDDQGEWMPRHTHLAAVARLKAEVERLTAEVSYDKRCELHTDKLAAEFTQAQVERLTKAGDALTTQLHSLGYDSVWDFWNAAKEGTQS